MKESPEELLEEARQHLIKAKTYIKENPIEDFVKLLVFSFYVYYRSSDKLIPRQRREFKDLFDKAINVVNLNQKIKLVMPEPLVYDTGNELDIINRLKGIPALLNAIDTNKKVLQESETIKAKEDKLNKAMSMINKSRFDGALNQFNELSRQFPNDYKIHKEMSWKLFEVKHIECITFLEKTVALNPNDAESFAALGQIFRKIKKYDDSIQAHLKSVELDGSNCTYLFNLARTYIDNREWGNARNVLQKLLTLDPDMVPAQQALSFVSRSLRGE